MDTLMTLMGEMVIAESVVLQNPQIMASDADLTDFKKAARQLSKITSQMQEVIMSMRMMPLTNTFQKMNRTVFDVSRKLGKDIEFEMIGDTTEVDKNIIEHISDPLLHLVRNAVDHGIESNEERAQAGKTEKGKVVLEAKNEGGKVWVSVTDNGKGLSKEKLFAKALKNGLVDPGRTIEDYTEKEVYQFITFPGFSTKEQVTEYSGRGVGMDVVVKNIQEVGGKLEIESQEGKGSSMIIKIPLTLAIIDGILLKVAGTVFVVETAVVREFIRVNRDMMIEEPDGKEYVMIRGEAYSVIRLNERYHLGAMKQSNKDDIMIVLEYEGSAVGIFVDELVGSQEVVVKPIPSYIRKVPGLSGCTQLGDGSIALILDIAGLLMSQKGET
jgi:two-component system chemotaxis sensor kinase CheA